MRERLTFVQPKRGVKWNFGRGGLYAEGVSARMPRHSATVAIVQALPCFPADGPLVDDSMEEVYEFIRTRLSPASRGQPRYDRIISIDVAAPESAMAKVQLAFGDRFFTDYLSLLRIDGQWRIISKTFTYVLLEVATVRLAAE